MKGVLLDKATLKPQDLELSQLLNPTLDWTSYDTTSKEETQARIAGATAVLTNKVILDEALMEATPTLKYIGILATGLNNVDLAAAKRLGITVENVEAYGTDSVVQHAMMLLLNLCANFLPYQRLTENKAWSRSPTFCMMDLPMQALAGKTMVIVGYGELGKKMATVAEAFGMQIVIAQTPGRNYPPEDKRMPFVEAVKIADVISLHCLQAPATEKMINADVLSQCKPGALLINTARGGLIDEQALRDALISGAIGGAGLDVLSQEPPSEDNPLLEDGIPNLLITPHHAWATTQARQKLVDIAAGKLADFLTKSC